jgi:hypothetical protein
MDILKRFDVKITYKLDIEIEDRDGNTFKQKRNGKMGMTLPKDRIGPFDDSYFIPRILESEMLELEEFQNDQNGFDKIENLVFSITDYCVEKKPGI